MATQKGRNWSSGDIVTAANLSSIERGVSAVAEEYTPTTWANGNTVTAAALNNIERGIVDGGSSDFSTATVTVMNNIIDSAPIYIPMVFSEDGTNAIVVADAVESGESVFVIPLYKGAAFLIALDDIGTLTTTGDVEYDDGTFIVTGDGTITISSSSGGQVVD